MNSTIFTGRQHSLLCRRYASMPWRRCQSVGSRRYVSDLYCQAVSMAVSVCLSAARLVPYRQRLRYVAKLSASRATSPTGLSVCLSVSLSVCHTLLHASSKRRNQIFIVRPGKDSVTRICRPKGFPEITIIPAELQSMWYDHQV